MKKILALILALLMVLGTCATLAACDGAKTPQESTSDSTTEKTEPQTTEAPTVKPTEKETTETPTEPVTTEPATTEPVTTEPVTTEPHTIETSELPATETYEPETTEPDLNLTVEQAIALVNSMENGKFTDNKYFITGTVTSVFIPSKGGIIISGDNGSSIRIASSFNEDGTVGYAQMETKPEIGDRIVVYGAIARYGEAAQMKDAWIMEFGEPAVPDLDLTIEQAINLAGSLQQGQFTVEKYFITGTVKSIFMPSKGSMILTDENGNTLRVNGSFNEDGTVGFAQMSVRPTAGDRIVIFGAIGMYNGSVQMNDGWIISFGEPESSEPESSEPETEAPETTSPETNETETTSPETTSPETNGAETDTADTEAPDTNAPDTNAPDTEAPDTNEPDAPKPDEDEKYGNGPDIEGAGAEWEAGFFPNVKHTVDESKAVSISAEELLAKMQDRDGAGALKKGEVWIVSEPLILESDSKYYGNGAAIIARGGIIIKDSVGVVIKDVIIRGNVSVENSAEVIFFKVDVESDTTTVTIDEKSRDITFKTTRIRGNTASVVSYADNVTIYNCYIYSHNGLRLVGDDVIVQNCRIIASLNAVYISGSDCVVRENSIETVDVGAAVTVYDSTNALVALNAIKGSQDTIKITESFNCSVILNSAIRITGTDNTNLYVIDNSLGGYLHLENNNYLIADGNTYSKDNLNHTVISKNNDNKNGGDVTDLNARVEVGANEDLLPHTNKELFVGMTRKSSVADASLAVSKGIGSYIEDLAREQSVIIVPPGAYASYSPIELREDQNNTRIYAYGALQEYAETDPLKADNLSLFFVGVSNVDVWGLTVGHTLPSSGQVRIIEKIREDNVYKLKVVADAGFIDGFTTTNPEIFHDWWPAFYLTDEDGNQKPYSEENQKSAHKTEFNYDEDGNYDGTMTITLYNKGSGGPNDENKTAKALWDKLEPGNVVTCRITFAAHKELTGSLIYLVGCKNVAFRDTVTYGSAGGMCVFTGNCLEGISFTRQHNTTRSGRVIDKETYDRYVAIGKQYGVDMEVYAEELEDGTIRYRGPASRSGSVDAFHHTSSKAGLNVTSSILEGMVDDGSNQKSNSSRLHGYKINDDGTVTLYYKNCASSVYWSNSTHLPSNELGFSSCKTFSKGDRIFVFTPEGRTVCDTTVLEAWTEKSKGVEFNVTDKNGINKHLWIDLFAVKVKVSDVDLDAFINPATGEEYDLTDNSYETTNRLSVDNLSWNCCGYTLDNVMVRNSQSRGFLVKAIDINIKHCTFKNVPNAGLLITIEPEYGETTIARNVQIQQCLFDNTGFNYGNYTSKMQSCIVIKGASSVVSEHTLPIDNITITGCKFTNNRQQTAIWVNSAKNIKIANNVFDPIVNETNKTRGIAVYLDVCMNVEISDNTYNYSSYNSQNGSIQNVVFGTQYVNVFGTDVTDGSGNRLYPDKVTTQR